MQTLNSLAEVAKSTFDLPIKRRLSRDYIQEGFEKFHAEHPDVYTELVQIAREEKSRGRRKWGMKAAYEILRSRRARSFMMNNNYTAIYGRLIMSHEPDLAGFFRLREKIHETN